MMEKDGKTPLTGSTFERYSVGLTTYFYKIPKGHSLTYSYLPKKKIKKNFDFPITTHCGGGEGWGKSHSEKIINLSTRMEIMLLAQCNNTPLCKTSKINTNGTNERL